MLREVDFFQDFYLMNYLLVQELHIFEQMPEGPDAKKNCTLNKLRRLIYLRKTSTALISENTQHMYEDDDFQDKKEQQKPISLSNVEMRLLLFCFILENHAADVRQVFSDI